MKNIVEWWKDLFGYFNTLEAQNSEFFFDIMKTQEERSLSNLNPFLKALWSWTLGSKAQK